MNLKIYFIKELELIHEISSKLRKPVIIGEKPEQIL